MGLQDVWFGGVSESNLWWLWLGLKFLNSESSKRIPNSLLVIKVAPPGNQMPWEKIQSMYTGLALVKWYYSWLELKSDNLNLWSLLIVTMHSHPNWILFLFNIYIYSGSENLASFTPETQSRLAFALLRPQCLPCPTWSDSCVLLTTCEQTDRGHQAVSTYWYQLLPFQDISFCPFKTDSIYLLQHMADTQSLQECSVVEFPPSTPFNLKMGEQMEEGRDRVMCCV